MPPEGRYSTRCAQTSHTSAPRHFERNLTVTNAYQRVASGTLGRLSGLDDHHAVRQVRRQAIASLERYVAEELDQDVGDPKAGLFLDYFLKEIAQSVYNGAIADAQTYLRDRVADLEGACAVPEFAYWPKATVRRPSR